MARKRLGDILIEAHLLDEAKLQVALAEQQTTGMPLGRVLVDLNYITEAVLLKALSKQLNLPIVDIKRVVPEPEVVALLPRDFALRHKVLPFKRDVSFICVAMSDPTDAGVTDQIRDMSHLVVSPYLVGEDDLVRALQRAYPAGAAGRGTVPPPADRPRRKTRTSLSVIPQFAGTDARLDEAEKAIATLAARCEQLEKLHTRDEGVIRQLCLLLIEKRVVTRDEILQRVNKG